MTIEELIDRYGDGVFRLCLVYLGDRQLAEDAFQETFLRAWKHLPQFRGQSSERTWLTRIAVNVWADICQGENSPTTEYWRCVGLVP